MPLLPFSANTARAAQPTLAQTEPSQAQFLISWGGWTIFFHLPRAWTQLLPQQRGEKGNTDQVADVGQVLVGEDRLSIQICHVHQAGQHWLGHLIPQHGPLLVDISCAQGTALIAARYKLLPGRACPENNTS